MVALLDINQTVEMVSPSATTVGNEENGNQGKTGEIRKKHRHICSLLILLSWNNIKIV